MKQVPEIGKTYNCFDDGNVIYNGYNCIVLRVWDEYWYDLQTKENTEKGLKDGHYDEVKVGDMTFYMDNRFKF